MSSQKPLRRCVTGNTEYVTTISIGLSRHGSAVSDSWSRSGQPPGQAEAFEVESKGWTTSSTVEELQRVRFKFPLGPHPTVRTY